MALDVLSPRGAEAVAQSRAGLALVGQQYVETQQDREGDIDGFFLSSDGREIVAAFEAKARDMTLEMLRTKFRNEWILTFDKIVRGAAIAKATRVPLLGVCYLIPSDTTLVIRLADEDGNIVAPCRIEMTKTRATCNGGTAIRSNAYVSMAKARAYAYRSNDSAGW